MNPSHAARRVALPGLLASSFVLLPSYVYAYSVDDAVGNMQTTGEGLIIAIGGSDGLPNPKPATSPIHMPFGWAATDPSDGPDAEASLALWPPDHTYRTLTTAQMVQSATDSCTSSLSASSAVIQRITSDELDNAPGETTATRSPTS